MAAQPQQQIIFVSTAPSTRVNLDSNGCVWTGEFDFNTLRVDGKTLIRLSCGLKISGYVWALKEPMKRENLGEILVMFNSINAHLVPHFSIILLHSQKNHYLSYIMLNFVLELAAFP